MIFRTLAARELDRGVLTKLRALTNDVSRGDIRDDGKIPGSVFRRRIDEHLDGTELFPDDCWVVLAYDWTKLAGWCMVTGHFKDHECLPLTCPTAAAGFYVGPNYRRNGLGLELVREAENVARKNGMARLLVNPWNSRSDVFFRKAGFVEATPYIPGWTYGIAYKDLEPIEARVIKVA